MVYSFQIDKMNTIGFTKEIDDKIIEEKFLDKPENYGRLNLNDSEKIQLIDYLNNSEVIFSITLGLMDNETYIGAYRILTDGGWLWPSHFSYYLNKNGLLVSNPEFLDSIKNRRFRPRHLTKEEKAIAISFLENEALRIKRK
jgi:hypothetical protein